jgi:uncharacterized protein (TIGR00369 family)
MTEPTKTLTWTDPRPTAALARQLSGLEFLSRIVDGEIPPPPIQAHMNQRFVSVSEGDAVFEGTPEESHYNPIGVVHAGFAMTLLDSAAACAVHSTLPQGMAYTTLETKVSLLRAITTDTGVMRAHGWIVRPGSKAAFSQADLRDADGKVYATATSTCAVFPVG